VSRFLTTNQHN